MNNAGPTWKRGLAWGRRSQAFLACVGAVLGLVVAAGPIRGAVQDYDAAVVEDSAGGLVPAARLTTPAVFTGANRSPFNFGTVSGDVTVEFIVEGNPAAITGSGFLAVGTNTASSLRYEQWQNTGQLGFTQAGVLDYLFSPGIASPTVATHLAWVWESASATMRLYVNGSLSGVRSAVTASFAMPTGQGWLGGNHQGGEYMVGTIHRVTVYDTQVSPEVLLRHADAFRGIVRPPVLVRFGAEPGVIFSPEPSVLSWDVRQASRVLLNGADVTGQTNAVVSPSATTEYFLVATNQGGAVTGRVAVVVNPAPVVREFVATPAYVEAGGTVNLSWRVEHGTEFWIDAGVGEVTASTANGEGTRAVTVAASTHFTLSAGNAFGTNRATASVLVVHPAAHVVISEFSAGGGTGVVDEDGDPSDWIEVFNPTASAIDLAGYYLTDDRSDPTLWAFPATNLAAGGHLLVHASGKDRRVAGAPLHANFRLARSGEFLALVGPGLVWLQVFDPYPAQESGASRGLLGGDLSTARDFGVPTPGALNNGAPAAPGEVTFSRASGTFVDSFQVELIPPRPGLLIRYTLDGSAPGVTNGLVYQGPIGIAATRRVRAVAIADGDGLGGNDPRAGRLSGATYLKLAPDLAAYSSSLPVLVIDNFGAGVIPQKGWSGTGAGVRQVPRQRAVWATFGTGEKGAGSGSLTNPPQMLSAIGIRGRGAFSSQWRQKPYSVEAVGEDDSERAVSPLGMPDHADWVLYFPDPDTNKDPTLLFNTFVYELSRNSGRYSVRFRWVELVVNEDGGDLQLADRRGVYALLEKVSRGGERLDFERLSEDGTSGTWLLNINRMDPEPEAGWPAENGATQPWFFHTAGPNRILQTAPNAQVVGDDEPQQSNAYINFDNPSGYTVNAAQRAAIEGWFRQFEDVLWNNAIWRDPTNGYRRFLDPVDFADYFILHNLTRNGDGLLISMFPWKGNDGLLRMGPAWDYNWSSYFISGQPATTLLHRPERLWYGRLFADPDFAQLHVDRWWDHRRGAMSNAGMDAIIDGQASVISPAKALLNGMPSEAEWATRLAQMKTWLKDRANWIDGNFVRPPVFSQEGGVVGEGFVLSIFGTNGTIYYSLDGSDPRAPGGAVAPGAVAFQAPIPILAWADVRARVRSGTNWSGLTRATFVPPRDLSGLILTEIHYNPVASATWPGSELEFVELANLGPGAVSLGGLAFTGGIEFAFTNGTRLEAGARLVLGRNAAALASRYPGLSVHGVYAGQLDNAGETIRLEAVGGSTVFAVTYDDRPPWPVAPDGHGFSLVPRADAPRNSDFGQHWRASAVVGGSPGAPDPEPSPAVAPVWISEIAARPAVAGTGWAELHNPGPAPVAVGGWYLSDDPGYPRKHRILPGTVLAAGGRILVSESELNAVPGAVASFPLSAAGGSLCLVSADLDGNLTGFSHGVAYGASPVNATLGRWVASTGEERWPEMIAPTPGGVESGPRVGPIVISEIHYHPSRAEPEFVELRNAGAAPVVLHEPLVPTNAWRLNGLGFQFPPGLVMPAGATLVVAGEAPEAFRARYGLSDEVLVVGPAGGVLQDSGERLELQRPESAGTNGVIWITVDAVRYNDRQPWPSSADGGGASLQRRSMVEYGDDPAAWVGAVPTPGAAYIPAGEPPVIVVQPVDTTVVGTREASFAVTAAGVGPLYYQWLAGTSLLVGATNATLVLTNVQAAQAGDYAVVVFNAAGSVRSRAARLVVRAPAQILDQPRDVQVRVRPDPLAAPVTNATFSVTAASSTALRYQWEFEGQPIVAATNPVLVVTNVQVANGGRYRAAVTDEAGTVFSREAFLTPWVSPQIVQPPLSQSVPVGALVTLSVEVSGNPVPFTYEWRRSSIGQVTNVSTGRVDLYRFTAAAVPQTNQYRVVVKNAANSIPGVASGFVSVITLADGDGDGLPDEWELANGLNPASAADRLGDGDGDGMSNGDEFVAGTDPRDPASHLRVEPPAVTGLGATIRFGAVSNRTYAVERAMAPSGPWTVMALVPARGTNRVERIVDPSSAAGSAGYYRVATPGATR